MVQKLIQHKADITLGYWGIRGLAQPIRFLLIASDISFSEVRFGVLQDGTILDESMEDDDWNRVKFKLEMPFPNLPYLIDSSEANSISISQSNTILRYLARRFDFYGDSDIDRIEIDMLQDEAYDFRNKIIETAYTLGHGYAFAFKQFSSDILPVYLDRFESYLINLKNRDFFVGDRLSLVDFVLYELFWQMTLMVPGSIQDANRPALSSFIRSFEKTPKIANYIKSKNYIEHPINSPWASFT
jgi:glutathione S-transferase